MNGIDAMLAIRGEFPDARIIVLTTYAATSRHGALSKRVPALIF
jgi:ActR/RegA family two-component response regulator